MSNDGAPSERRLLLAAEDSEAHRLVLSRIMSEVGRADAIGIDLRVVRNGVQLLDYLDRPADGTDAAGADEARPWPDLILLDLHMPAMGGMETLGRLRDDPRLRAIPVVIMSSSDTPAHIDAAYALGDNAFLVKLGDRAALLEQMQSFSSFWLRAAKLPSVADL